MCVRIGGRTEGYKPQTRGQAHLSAAPDISDLVAVAESFLSGCRKYWPDGRITEEWSPNGPRLMPRARDRMLGLPGLTRGR